MVKPKPPPPGWLAVVNISQERGGRQGWVRGLGAVGPIDSCHRRPTIRLVPQKTTFIG